VRNVFNKLQRSHPGIKIFTSLHKRMEKELQKAYTKVFCFGYEKPE